MSDYTLPYRIHIIYEDKSKNEDIKSFTPELLNDIFIRLEEKISKNESFYLTVERERDFGSLHLEYANGCCGIQMGDGEIGYDLYNPEESDEPIDLFINSYPRCFLHFFPENSLKIVKTYILTGKPDENYQWEKFYM